MYYIAKLEKKTAQKSQMRFTVKDRIFTIVCIAKVFGFLPIQFCHERIRIAKSTSVIVMGIFTVTLSHLPRIVIAAVCTASLFAFSHREDFVEQDQTWMESVPEIVRKHD